MPGTIKMMYAHGCARPVLAACTTSEMSRSSRTRTSGMTASVTRSDTPARGPTELARSVLTMCSRFYQPEVSRKRNRCAQSLKNHRSGCLREMRHQSGEQPAPVGAADGGLHMVFRMRHQAEHVELLVQHAGNRIERAVDVGFRIALALGIGVAEQDAAFGFQPPDRTFAGDIVALAMRHRHADHLAGIVAARE